jgi:TPR repeat protein
MKRLIVAVLLLVAVATAQADLYEDAKAAYSRGDYATALRLVRPLAETGNADAQSSLGVMYDYGHGVPQDYAEALKSYRLAAKQGNAKAQFNLGVMYSNGRGVPQDYAEALKWFRLAAAQGNAIAQGALGVMYDNGQGVPQDYVQAHKWLSLSASRQTDENMRDIRTESRDIVAAKMTSSQLAEAQKLAREWNPKE